MRTLFASLMILAIAGTASATITITAGTHDVLENATNQTFDILISTDASDIISGCDFAVQIGPTGQSCPAITAFDATTAGRIFFGDDSAQTYGIVPGYPGISVGGVTGPLDPNYDPVASGILLTVTIDTTGYYIADGPYVIKLMTNYGNTEAHDGNGWEISGTVYNSGTLNIIPEPATLALLSLAAVGFLIHRRRR